MNFQSSPQIQWQGSQDDEFVQDFKTALAGLQNFSDRYGWVQPRSAGFIKEIRHFSSKEAFDEELQKLSKGTMDTSA